MLPRVQISEQRHHGDEPFGGVQNKWLQKKWRKLVMRDWHAKTERLLEYLEKEESKLENAKTTEVC